MSMDEAGFKQTLLTLLAEGFGVSDADSSFFLDDGRAGLLGTLDKLDAATASAGLRPENATISAHANHVRFLLDIFIAYERGEQANHDWASSWAVQTVDAAAWDALRAGLRARYTTLMDMIRARTEWPAPAVGGALILLAHVPYHTGEIKQIITSLAA